MLPLLRAVKEAIHKIDQAKHLHLEGECSVRPIDYLFKNKHLKVVIDRFTNNFTIYLHGFYHTTSPRKLNQSPSDLEILQVLFDLSQDHPYNSPPDFNFELDEYFVGGVY